MQPDGLARARAAPSGRPPGGRRAKGSFGRAAKRLGYTQSAISQQIAALERIVGQRLIERPGGPRPVTLTEAGALLLTPRARPSRRDCRRRRPTSRRSAPATPGRSASARTSRVGARILPTLLSSFSRRMAEGRHPARRVDRRPRAARSSSSVARPTSASASSRSSRGPFEAVELMRDPYVLVVASRLAARPSARSRRRSARSSSCR